MILYSSFFLNDLCRQQLPSVISSQGQGTGAGGQQVPPPLNQCIEHAMLNNISEVITNLLNYRDTPTEASCQGHD